MSRFAAVTCLLAGLIPIAAGAQVRDTVPVAPGISVSGRGVATVPADRVKILVRLTPRNVTGEQLEKLGASVADAMRAGGIDDAAVVLPIVGYLGPQSALAVIGSVAKPTRESMQAVLVKTLAAVPDATATALANGYQVQASYSADDCSAAEERAVTSAVADARARAERVAKASGLQLGAIEAVSESAFFTTGCGAEGDLQNGNGASDPYGPLTISLTAVLNVRFAVLDRAPRP